MKNVLFIVGESWYPSNVSANGSCSLELAKEFQKHVNVFVLATDGNNDFTDKLGNIKIYRSKKRIRESLDLFVKKHTNSKISRFLRSLVVFILSKINMYRFPYSDSYYCKKMYKLGLKICSENKIDTILCFVNPVENYDVARKLIKKYPNIKLIVNALDSYSFGRSNIGFSNKIKNKILSKWEKDMLNRSFVFLTLKNYYNHYSSNNFKEYNGKILYTDIPLFNKIECKNIVKNNELTFIYSGSLYYDIRNPKYCCELFNNLAKSINFKFKFYSRGDCVEIVEKYSIITNNKIMLMDYVSREENINNLFNSDAIISIGSKNCSMVPSKIFEYMSTGKKIIHIVSDEKNDVAISYLKNYPNILFIYEKNSVERNCELIKDFINKKNKNVNMKDLEQVFEMNKPEFTYKILEKEVAKNEKF